MARLPDEGEAGISVADLCRKHGVSDATVYKWKARYGGMDVSEATRLATCYDRCPIVFLSAIALAATVLFWL